MAPSNVQIELVQNPTESLTEEAVQIFAQVMSKDPASFALTGGNLSLIPDLGRTMIRALILCPDISHVFTARDDTGALVGYTIFALPGQCMLSTPEQMEKANFDEFMRKMSPEGQAYYAETMTKKVPQVNNENLAIDDAERKTYWCNFAMVRADYQSKGVAKALFELAFKEADRLEATVALTTTNVANVIKYQKIGFKYCDTVMIESPWGEWGLWFFKREHSM